MVYSPLVLSLGYNDTDLEEFYPIHMITGVGDTGMTEAVKICTHAAHRLEEGATQNANKGVKYLPRSDTCWKD